MAWFGVKSLYHFGESSKGLNIFEERIVVFEADDSKLAHAKAEQEAEEYAQDNDFKLHNDQIGYRQDGKPLIDGYEVWSELFEASLTLEQFYEEHHEKYSYCPDDT